jgi:hypothetical protein
MPKYAAYVKATLRVVFESEGDLDLRDQAMEAAMSNQRHGEFEIEDSQFLELNPISDNGVEQDAILFDGKQKVKKDG